MARYQIITLVDITRTNPPRNESNELRLGQQANFNSLIQAIGMRANVEWTQDPRRHEGRMPDSNTKISHWLWEFEAERDQVFYKTNDDPVGLLLDDLSGVPVVVALTEAADINPAVFDTRSDSPNTWVTQL